MDQVCDRSPSELFGTQFTERKLHRVDDVALTRTIGSRYHCKAAIKIQRHFLPEGLETSEINPTNVDQERTDPDGLRETFETQRSRRDVNQSRTVLDVR